MGTETLADELERDRLRSRMRRMERVTAALRERAVYRATGGTAPLPLRQAIAGFEREIITMRRRLNELDRAPSPSTRTPALAGARAEPSQAA